MTSALNVATLVAPAGTALAANDIEAFAARLSQSGGVIRETKIIDPCAADIFFTGAPDFSASDLSCDVIVQVAARRRKKILIADMESTIIGQEMLDELAIRIGVGEKVAAITRRAMNGELDFTAALQERVALLKGHPESLLRDVAKSMTVNPGAHQLVAAMKRTGAHCWLVSGGFIFFVKMIAERIGFDRFFANDLKLENGLISGQVSLPILGRETKQDLLEKACNDYACTLADCLTVGDGANDLPMLEACQDGGGLAVAYRAKPRVRAAVTNQINHSDFSALLYAQGFSSF